MPEYRLPGLSIELPEGGKTAAPVDAAKPLSQLLDDQQAALGTAGLMGWRRLPADDDNLNLALEAAAALRSSSSELLVIGMGGSVNGARAVYRALELSGSVNCAVEFLDNPDPLSMISVLEIIDADNCAVLAVSRSGSTVETIAMLATALQHVRPRPDRTEVSPVAVASLAGDNPLLNLARKQNWMHVPLPADTGGRFSVFSPAGLVPLAFSGIDIRKLLVVADETSAALEELPAEVNPAWLLSGMLLAEGMDNVMLYSYADQLNGFGEWWRQLLAESCGRKLADGSSLGLQPILARGPADQHSQNQLYLDGPADSTFVFLDVETYGTDLSVNRNSELLPEGFAHLGGLEMSRLMQASEQGTLQALSDSGRPCARISLDKVDEQGMGSLLQFWMHVVACLGLRMDINPYDQPAVERSKRITDSLLRNPDSK